MEAGTTTGKLIGDEAINPARSGVMLSGMCRLGFEDQFFFPDSEPTRQCWLEVEPAARTLLAEMLGPDWYPDLDEFHATFWGIVRWSPGGCGHLGGSTSYARMDELISARILPRPTFSAQRTIPGGIRGRLRAARDEGII